MQEAQFGRQNKRGVCKVTDCALEVVQCCCSLVIGHEIFFLISFFFEASIFFLVVLTYVLLAMLCYNQWDWMKSAYSL
jgi:hypothetical protein